MSYQLVDSLKVPPGEYVYVQTVGITRRFPGTPLIENQATLVADFRKGNNLPRATFEDAMEDIVQYTCERLGGMSKWCFSTDANFKATAPVLTKRRKGGCSACGARLHK